MNRTKSENAIVLDIKKSGENNSSVTFLCEKSGIVFATLYGGPKSKLKSLVTLWNIGIVYLYENQETNQIKVSDFDVKYFQTTFSQDLYKFFSASLVSELMILTRCAGSPSESYNLVNGFFRGMELSSEEQSKTGLIRFLWRFLELLGVQPQISNCFNCEKSFLEAEFEGTAESYYNVMENSFMCEECFNAENSLRSNIFSLSMQSLSYLHGITVLKPSESRKLSISKKDYEDIKNFVFFLIQNNIERKINTFETGKSIL